MDLSIEPEKSLERQIRAFHWVRLLAELPGRRAGSLGEREAATRAALWLDEVGADEVRIEFAPSRPQPGFAMALHLLLAALGCAVGAGVGALQAALAAASWLRERRGRSGLSQWLPAPEVATTVGRVHARGGRARRRIVLAASLDASPAGRLFAAPRRWLARGPGSGGGGPDLARWTEL